MSNHTLTESQIAWFAERIDTAPSGKVIVKSNLITKFKKMFPASSMSNEVARSDIIRNCQQFI